jgi:hypothetical protein
MMAGAFVSYNGLLDVTTGLDSRTGGESNFNTVLASRLVKHSGTRIVQDLNRICIHPTCGDFRTTVGTRRRFSVVGVRDKDVASATDGVRSGFNRYLRREVSRRTTTAPENDHAMLTIRRLDITEHRVVTCRGPAGDEATRDCNPGHEFDHHDHGCPQCNAWWTSNDLAFSCERT